MQFNKQSKLHSVLHCIRSTIIALTQMYVINYIAIVIAHALFPNITVIHVIYANLLLWLHYTYIAFLLLKLKAILQLLLRELHGSFYHRANELLCFSLAVTHDKFHS